MALSVRARPFPARVLLVARLHYASPAAMDATRSSLRSVEFPKSALGLGFSGSQSASSCRHNWSVCTKGSSRQRCFCSSSGSQHHAEINTSNGEPANQDGKLMEKFSARAQQQQQPFGAMPQKSATNVQSQQQPVYPSSNATYQPQQTSYGGTGGNPSPQQTNVSAGSPSSAGSPAAGVSSRPRSSAAAEVIDKYLGPSTLKLEKQEEKSVPPPPPPPPRRNYGPHGTQEKKSGKDLVAESAACAVIEKYLGPWPGFPPRDPKIDEYLDSLPENAACAAIDKYFGPYKPLFVFKKNEENANSPPPPSRPPRNRMTSRARNRAWNSSQQGASVDRPWTAPTQQAPQANSTQGGQYSPPARASPSQGASSVPSAQVPSFQNGDKHAIPPPGTIVSQSGGVSPNQHGPHSGVPPQPGATTISPSQSETPYRGASNQ